MYKFTKDDGSKVRPWDDVLEADEEMIKRWNSVVSETDRVYHLGDVALSKNGLKLMDRLNGSKILIRGNHDREKLSIYTRYFKDIRGAYTYKNFILTHLPVHPGRPH